MEIWYGRGSKTYYIFLTKRLRAPHLYQNTVEWVSFHTFYCVFFVHLVVGCGSLRAAYLRRDDYHSNIGGGERQ